MNVYATFETPERWYNKFLGGTVTGQMMTDPYQIIVIPRDTISTGRMVFNLVGNGTVVYSVEVNVF